MSEYLTVSQAAARLGISERTLRKRIKAGEIEAEKRPIEGGGIAWQVLITPERSRSDPEAERKNAPEAVRKPAELETAPERKRSGNDPKSAPEVSGPRTGSDPEAGLLDHLRQENAFLRSMVEQHQRSEAELRAALRKALDAMPKALPDASTPASATEPREDAPQADLTTNANQTTGASTPAPQRAGKRPKLTAWQRVAARILGIRA